MGVALANHDLVTLDYTDLAVMQLEMAMQHHESRTLEGYICASTLARAAVGILEGHPDNNGSSFSYLKSSVVAVNETGLSDKFVGNALNHMSNGLKHFKGDFDREPFYPEEEARCLIYRGLLALYTLKIEHTETMKTWFAKARTRPPAQEALSANTL